MTGNLDKRANQIESFQCELAEDQEVSELLNMINQHPNDEFNDYEFSVGCDHIGAYMRIEVGGIPSTKNRTKEAVIKHLQLVLAALNDSSLIPNPK